MPSAAASFAGSPREDLLVGGERHVRAAEPRVVPARRAHEERGVLGRAELRALDRLGERLERLCPRRLLLTAEALDLRRVLVARRHLAERLRERDDGLLRVLELARVEATDLGERAAALLARRRRLALLEEHLDELLVLAERLAHLLERDRSRSRRPDRAR